MLFRLAPRETVPLYHSVSTDRLWMPAEHEVPISFIEVISAERSDYSDQSLVFKRYKFVDNPIEQRVSVRPSFLFHSPAAAAAWLWSIDVVLVLPPP